MTSLANDRKRFYDVLGKAQNSFWENIVNGYPEITTGDMSPGAIDRFEQVCKATLDAWIDANEPKEQGAQRALSFIMLSIQSRHFEFEAIGRDLKEAQEVLLAGWTAHRKNAPADVLAQMPGPTLQELEEAFEIKERALSTGSFYRDSEPVKIVRLEESMQDDYGINSVPSPRG